MKTSACILTAALVLLAGCGRKTNSIVTDATGSNQLALVYRGVWGGYDFDSLVWRKKVGSRWKDHLVVSEADFQGSNPWRRWVSDVDSIDPTNGTAIIKVAEGDAPEGGTVNYVYSWREWNLVTNGETKFFRICTNVFDKF